MKPSELADRIAEEVEWIDPVLLAFGRIGCVHCSMEASAVSSFYSDDGFGGPDSNWKLHVMCYCGPVEKSLVKSRIIQVYKDGRIETEDSEDD